MLVSSILNWWVPYLFGVYPAEIALDTFLEEYSGNVTVLPPPCRTLAARVVARPNKP